MKTFFSIVTILHCALAWGQDKPLNSYDVVWNTPSKNSSESMPCGGGDIGLNVWVENGELLIYVSRSGTFDENNALLKAGRLRISMQPNLLEGATFEQRLNLNDGHITIKGTKGSQKVNIDIWVDVFRPVSHIDINSSVAVTTSVSFENWRHQDRAISGRENNSNAYKWTSHLDIKTFKDEITFSGNDVLFYHRNKDFSVFDITVKQQGLDSVKSQLYNPLLNLTFGGILRAEGMTPDGTTESKYHDTPFKAWRLKSSKPTRHQEIKLFQHTAQTKSVDAWKEGLNKLIQSSAREEKHARSKTLDWWHQLWKQSFILINVENGRQDVAWQTGRNYQLFRYMLACNAYGNFPTKFNGGLFTYDPSFTDTTLRFTPDFRNWGGGTMTAQNQRLVYYPMIKNGDADFMKSQLHYYLKILKNAELRTKVYWKHNGACFTEQMENFGLPNPAEYGWQRPTDFDPGIEYNAWLEYQWDTVFEFCLMMLDLELYFNHDISEYIPFIESCLTFFDEHYQYLAKKRGRMSLDGNGHLILFPTSANETYKMAYNATPTLAALQVILTRLVQLPESYLTSEQRKHWQEMRQRIPPIGFKEHEGHKTIAPAYTWERINNVETSQLYPVFPWGLYGVGKPDLDVALNTWRYDPHAVSVRSHRGWKQDNIFAARLGLTHAAAELTTSKLKDSERRFPAFWGPGFDWTPDHNWGGSGMIGLQEMLLQTNGDTVYLFPAWPKEWDVHFKLHAPKNTVIEARMRNGIPEVISVLPESRRKDVIIYAEKK